jgi:hypothetical protein
MEAPVEVLLKLPLAMRPFALVLLLVHSALIRPELPRERTEPPAEPEG